jgi:ADP-ribose pyrophosphatase YjhB (NUDIX family)
MAKKFRRTISRGILEHSNLITAVGGLIMAADTGRGLFLLRDQDTYSNCWGLVGGRVEGQETPLQALARECREETGHRIHFEKIIPIELYQSSDNHFNYHTYICIAETEFMPRLNTEHQGYAWAPVTQAPRPLHPGLYNSFNTEVMKNKLQLISNSVKMGFVQDP